MKDERMMWVEALHKTAEKYREPWGRTFLNQDECFLCGVAEEIRERGSRCGNCIFHANHCTSQISYIEAKDDYLKHKIEIHTPLSEVNDEDTFDLPLSFIRRAEELETLAELLEYTVQETEYPEFADEYFLE